MQIPYSSCESGGVDLVWISGVERRPLERKPCSRADGEQGYLLVRRHGKPTLVSSIDHPNAPEHLRVHTCYIWLAERRNRVDSIGEILEWSEQVDQRRQDRDTRRGDRLA